MTRAAPGSRGQEKPSGPRDKNGYGFTTKKLNLDIEEIRRLYLEDRLSGRAIANKLGCSGNAIYTRMRKHKIPRRIPMNHTPKWQGPNNPKWKGGIALPGGSAYGIKWNPKRNEVLRRDHYTCQIYGCNEKENLEVHHLIPYRISKTHDLKNLITLCRKHHKEVEYSQLTEWLMNN